MYWLKQHLASTVIFVILVLPFALYFLLNSWGWLFFGHTPDEDRMAAAFAATAILSWLGLMVRGLVED